MTEFLPTITSITDWRGKIREAADLGLKRVCFFPTAIEPAARQEAYRLLWDAGIREIPFIHLRSDFTPDEVAFLMERFGTERFNIHPAALHPMFHDLSALRDRIYMENNEDLTEGDLRAWAGICLDVSHHENERLRGTSVFGELEERLKTTPVGCWHVSAIRPESRPNGHFDAHVLASLSELNYVARYKKYAPPIAAMELENPLREQLEAVEYVKRMFRR